MENNKETPHIVLNNGELASTVLMPGDPLRAKFVAENFLSKAKLVNNVRGIQGYTGMYKGKEVSVMASGMGMPSIGIYSYELFNVFNVQNIIRIGSAGALRAEIKPMEIIFALGACTLSSYSQQMGIEGHFAPIASFALLEKSVAIARELGMNAHVGNVVSTDAFYSSKYNEQWQRVGALAIEMECAALYLNAALAQKNALSMLTVSDNVITGEKLTAEQRQTAFTQMIEIALNTAI